MWRGLQRRKGQNVSDRRHIWVPHSNLLLDGVALVAELCQLAKKDVPAHQSELSVKAGIPTNFSLTQAGNSICNIFR